jgi:hypothetical protein
MRILPSLAALSSWTRKTCCGWRASARTRRARGWRTRCEPPQRACSKGTAHSPVGGLLTTLDQHAVDIAMLVGEVYHARRAAGSTPYLCSNPLLLPGRTRCRTCPCTASYPALLWVAATNGMLPPVLFSRERLEEARGGVNGSSSRSALANGSSGGEAAAGEPALTQPRRVKREVVWRCCCCMHGHWRTPVAHASSCALCT